MEVKVIDPRGFLSASERKIVEAKLKNPDEASVVPLSVVANSVLIGSDLIDAVSDWAWIGQRLVQRSNSV